MHVFVMHARCAFVIVAVISLNKRYTYDIDASSFKNKSRLLERGRELACRHRRGAPIDADNSMAAPNMIAPTSAARLMEMSRPVRRPPRVRQSPGREYQSHIV